LGRSGEWKLGIILSVGDSLLGSLCSHVSSFVDTIELHDFYKLDPHTSDHVSLPRDGRCYPIAGATFTQEGKDILLCSSCSSIAYPFSDTLNPLHFHIESGYLMQKLAAANVGATLVIVFILIRIYSGWSYIGARLTNNVIEYEESGWYDGDFERKSQQEQLRDELLYEDQVKPVVDRLKLFSLGAGALWVASCVAYNVSLSVKPKFDEYNPAMLERLRYDDKLADVAAQQSSGRPTYCDSRYVSLIVCFVFNVVCLRRLNFSLFLLIDF